MQVTLNIENDKELRTYIKEAIKNQVLSIVREEFLTIVTEELDRKMKNSNLIKSDYEINKCMTSAIQNILYKEHKVSQWNRDFIIPYIEKRVSDAINSYGENFKILVDKSVKEKINNLLK